MLKTLASPLKSWINFIQPFFFVFCFLFFPCRPGITVNSLIMFRKKKSRVRTWLSVDARIPETWLSYLSCYFMITLKNYGPFLWMGFNCLMATELLWGDSLLFTPKFPEIPGIYSSDQPQKDEKLSQPWNHLFVYQPSYYQIQIKVTIS